MAPFPHRTRVFVVPQENTKTRGKNTTTQKYQLIPAPAATGESKPFYVADAEKSITIVMLPNPEEKYEIVVKPSGVSSSEASIAIADGWRLTSVGTKSGENQIIGKLGEIVSAAIGAGKDVKVANIGKEQAIELAKLKADGAAGDAESGAQAAAAKKGQRTVVRLTVVGYVKRIALRLLPIGLYSVDSFTKVGGLRGRRTVFWSRLAI